MKLSIILKSQRIKHMGIGLFKEHFIQITREKNADQCWEAGQEASILICKGRWKTLVLK